MAEEKEFHFWKDKNSPTRNLLITNSLVYLITVIISIIHKQIFTTSEIVLIYIGQYNAKVLKGHIYMLITAIFIHASVLHFLSNMLFLLIYALLLLLTKSFDSEDGMILLEIEKRFGMNLTLVKRILERFI